MKRNENFKYLKVSYIFPEVNMRKELFLEEHPEAHLLSLGVGDTTKPISKSITKALFQAAKDLGTSDGYSGYGPEQGIFELRRKIAEKIYRNHIKEEEVFISDGAKCDLSRLQMMFGRDISIAVQDPTYPVYVEGSIIMGVKEIVPMPCNPENNFFPDLKSLPRTDLIYFCSPNNPTGAVATRKQLEELVAFAKKNRSIIIFDSAYSIYIQEDFLPKSIYEIEGAKEVAIEVSSFSKLSGFTGVRLGWTIVPKDLKYDDGNSVRADWDRMMTTLFNGASNISQKGGLAVLEDQGMLECKEIAHYYLENAKIIKDTLQTLRYEVFGASNAPYVWVRFKKPSWDIFQEFLEKYNLITTPGSGFGPSGEGFLRLTSFGKREDVLEAMQRLKKR